MHEDTLTKFVIASAATGVLGLLAFSLNWIFRSVFKRLDKQDTQMEEMRKDILGEMKHLSGTLQMQEQRLALGNQAFATMKEGIDDLKRRVSRIEKKSRPDDDTGS